MPMKSLATALAAVAVVIAAATVTAAHGALAADATDPNAIQLKFLAVDGSFSTQMARVQVAMKNATDTDIAQIMWTCAMRYKGRLVGRDNPITFEMVPKKSLAVSSDQLVIVDGGMFDQVNCDFFHKADVTEENRSTLEQVVLTNHFHDQLVGPFPINNPLYWPENGVIHGNLGNLIPRGK